MDKIKGTEIAVLGTYYKSGVRDERGSPALDLIKRLRNDGFSVETFNPKSSNKEGLRAVVQNKDTVIVTIPEVAFRELGKNLGERVKVVLDYSNIVDGRLIPAGVRFWQAGHGWSILSTSQRRREQL
jgi:UDP-N-acetyl-D-mannosaminuronate dehydrogenase